MVESRNQRFKDLELFGFCSYTHPHQNPQQSNTKPNSRTRVMNNHQNNFFVSNTTNYPINGWRGIRMQLQGLLFLVYQQDPNMQHTLLLPKKMFFLWTKFPQMHWATQQNLENFGCCSSCSDLFDFSYCCLHKLILISVLLNYMCMQDIKTAHSKWT